MQNIYELERRLARLEREAAGSAAPSGHVADELRSMEADGYSIDYPSEMSRLSRLRPADAAAEISRMRKCYKQQRTPFSVMHEWCQGSNRPDPRDQIEPDIHIFGSGVARLAMGRDDDQRPLDQLDAGDRSKAAVARLMKARESTDIGKRRR
ncbi:MAG: hypothetical protein ACLQGP_26170 [Isosphaeraceae bacterium]